MTMVTIQKWGNSTFQVQACNSYITYILKHFSIMGLNKFHFASSFVRPYMVWFQRYWDLIMHQGVNRWIVHIFSGQKPNVGHCKNIIFFYMRNVCEANDVETRDVSHFLLSKQLHWTLHWTICYLGKSLSKFIFAVCRRTCLILFFLIML